MMAAKKNPAGNTSRLRVQLPYKFTGIYEIRSMKLLASISALMLCAWSAHAQSVKLELRKTVQGHTSTWSLYNAGTDTIDINSLICQTFYTHPATLVFPKHVGRPLVPGGNIFQGKFRGENRLFPYKRISNIGFDTAIAPGIAVPFMEISNTSQSGKDTVLVGGVLINYNLSPVTGASTVAYPAGTDDCITEYLFADAGVSGQGIKYHSFLASNIHYGTCEPGAVIVVFDGNTLKRKSIQGFTPHCYWARAWRDFGFPEDFQVYYSANLNTAAGRDLADSLIRAVPEGDYIAWMNHSMVDMNIYQSISATLALFGVAAPGRNDNTPGYMIAIGRKGIAPGLANTDTCSSSHLNCNISLQQGLTGKAPAGTMPAYASCYESTFSILGEAPEMQGLNRIIARSIKLYPNPGSGPYQLELDGAQPLSVHCFDMTGRQKSLTLDGSTLYFTEPVSAGMYILNFTYPDGSMHHIRLIRE
jgi:hypothetical protein